MELLDITLSGWIAITIALSMAVLAGIMFILGKEKVHYVWGFFCVVVTIWAIGFYMVTLSDSPESAQFWWKIAYVGIILNPFAFFHFVLELINSAKLNRYKLLVLPIAYAVAFIFLYINLVTDLIVDEVTFLFEGIYYNTPPALLHPYFTVVFLVLVFTSLFLVFQEYKKSDNRVFRQRTAYFFVATIIGYIGGSMNFLAVYRIEMHPASNLGVAIGAAIIAYAILRYRLFDIKVVTAQLLTLILVSFSLIQLIRSSSAQETIFSVFLLIVVLSVGVYLIRSVRREVEQREEIEILAADLKRANERLKELDKLKSEFVSIASHQLRSPLTAIKGYASLILEGTYGKTSDAVHEAVQRIFDSSQTMIASVEDFLNVSRIEQGRMKYEMSVFDVGELAEKVVEELRPTADKKKLKLTYTEESKNNTIKADLGKVKQVIGNLVDNAIKYTKEGSINVSVTKQDSSIRVAVTDTGIGISEETISKLFDRFVRDRHANEVNVSGSGLGLYVAKQLVEGNKGKIWAESEGEGKGSTFIVELPDAR